MDEIDYFPKRDKFKVQKDVGSDWNKLKKQKINQPGKVKPSKTSPEEEVKKIANTNKIKIFCYMLLCILV